MVKCRNCGASVHFDPKKQLIRCDYCDSEYSAEETKDSLISKEDGSDLYESMVYTCPMCGAEIMQDRDTAVTFCSYCGSSVELSGRLVQMKAPEIVLPFQIPKEDAENLYRKFIGKSLFAPSYMKKNTQTEKIRGIYMPYWIYRMDCHKELDFKGSISTRSGDYIVTDHYKLTSKVDADYQGIAFDASSAYSDELSEAIAPYDFRMSKPFYPGYISGFYADAADVEPEVYEDDAIRTAASDIVAHAKEQPVMKKYHVTEDTSGAVAGINVQAKQLAYFPVWFLASRNKGYVSYAVINGQSGKVAADVPIDYGKFLIGSVLLAIPIMIGLDFFVSMKPSVLCALTVLFAIISMILTNGTMNRIYTRKNYYDDQGVLYSRGIDPNRLQRKALSGEKIYDYDLQPHAVTPQESWQPETEEAKKAWEKVQQEQAKQKTSAASTATSIFYLLGFGLIWFGAEYLPVCILIGFAFLVIAFLIGIFTSKTVTTTKKVAAPRPLLRQPYKEKLPVQIKPIIAIVLGAILFVIHPWQDFIYYIGVVVVMIPVLISYYDLIRLHNDLSRRMPRQFYERGEDLEA